MVAKYADNVAGIGAAVSAHSHYPYTPDRAMGLSRCTTRHMATVAAAEHESPLHTHQVSVVQPEKTLQHQDKGGMPNSCFASCHGDKINLWGYGLKPNPTIWNQSSDTKSATRLMEYYAPMESGGAEPSRRQARRILANDAGAVSRMNPVRDRGGWKIRTDRFD